MALIETPTDSGIILDRRQILSGVAALGLSATFGAMPAMAQGKPKKGGTLRMGLDWWLTL
jgi:peptide/nickel transport system substrate-binding protein